MQCDVQACFAAAKAIKEFGQGFLVGTAVGITAATGDGDEVRVDPYARDSISRYDRATTSNTLALVHAFDVSQQRRF